jgi:hypothetical protein
MHLSAEQVHYFILASTIIFGLLFLVWTRKDWGNLLIKGIFLFMMIAGILATIAA